MKDHFSRNVTALFVNVDTLFYKILFELELEPPVSTDLYAQHKASKP